VSGPLTLDYIGTFRTCLRFFCQKKRKQVLNVPM
jgi:hypothetical protein